MTPEGPRITDERRAQHEARRRAWREKHGLDPDEDGGEFMMVGPDGEMSDVQMHAEILTDDEELQEMAEAERKRWAARHTEIEREREAKRKAQKAYADYPPLPNCIPAADETD